MTSHPSSSAQEASSGTDTLVSLYIYCPATCPTMIYYTPGWHGSKITTSSPSQLPVFSTQPLCLDSPVCRCRTTPRTACPGSRHHTATTCLPPAHLLWFHSAVQHALPSVPPFPHYHLPAPPATPPTAPSWHHMPHHPCPTLVRIDAVPTQWHSPAFQCWLGRHHHRRDSTGSVW